MMRKLIAGLVMLLMPLAASGAVYTLPASQGTAYSDLTTAVNEIGNAEVDLYIVTTETVNDITIPERMRVHFEDAGSITVNAGMTLTFATKSIYAPNRPIFAGAGDVDFAAGTEVDIGWFSTGDLAFSKTLDDTIALRMTKQVTVASNAVVGNNVRMVWEAEGNSIIINSGRVLSNVKDIHAGQYQLFSGAGSVAFADGAHLNSAWFIRLRTALAMIGDSKVLLRIQRTEIIDLDSTVHANTTLEILPGGFLSPNAGTTLIVNGDIFTYHGVTNQSDFTSGLGTVVLNGSKGWQLDLSSTGVDKGSALVAGVIDVVRVTDYGATGDGVTNDRAAVENAIAVAVSTGRGLWFPKGVYRIPSASSLDLSGVVSIDGDDATLDLTESTANPYIICDGSRTALATGLTLAEGQTDITVSADLGLVPGDVILITSVEALPNHARTYYYKGERTYVTSYSSTTLKVHPPIEFSYAASAYLWKSNEQKIRVGRGIRIDFPRGVEGTGFRLKHANLTFEGMLTGGGNAAVIGYSSRMQFIGARIHDVYYTGTGTSYGIVAGDLSEVDVVGTEVLRARHCVDSGGGGYWFVDDSGGSGGGGASYPSKYRITGGMFVSAPHPSGFAITAHGSNLEAVITGATIYGGVAVGSKRTVITGCSIYAWDHAAFTISGDLWNGVYPDVEGDSGLDWGYVKVTDSLIEKVGEDGIYGPILVSGHPARLEFDGVTVRGPINDSPDVSQTYNRLLTLTGAQIGDIIIRNSHFENTNMQYGVTRPSQIYFLRSLTISDSYFTDGLIITPQADAATISIKDTKIDSHGYYGIYIVKKSGTTHRAKSVTVDGVEIIGAYYTGIQITEATSAIVQNSIVQNSGIIGSGDTNGRVGVYFRNVASVKLKNNDLRDTQDTPTQLYGGSVAILEGTVLTTELEFVNNDVRGNAIGGFLSTIGSTGTLVPIRSFGNLGVIANPFRDYLPNIPSYANNAAALAGGLVPGQLYHANGVVMVVTP